jgi:signal transduction histidine kinase
LRPTVLDDLGLVPALETYIAKWSENAGIAADFVVLGADGAFQHERMTPMIETIFYRVIQEALTNVLRHAGSDLTSVSVTLQRFDSAIQATIEDDGIGFDPDEASNSGRLGLAGMRERAALVDGTLDIESQPGQGTTVFLRVPGG